MWLGDVCTRVCGEVETHVTCNIPDENLIYYTSLAKRTRNFKTIITSEVIQYNIQIHKNIIYKFHKNNNDKTLVKAFPS